MAWSVDFAPSQWLQQLLSWFHLIYFLVEWLWSGLFLLLFLFLFGLLWFAWPFALAMLEFLWGFNSKTGSILLIDFPLPKKLTLCSFQPANQSECRWIILLWATTAARMQRKEWSLVNAWSHPEIQCISWPRSSSSAYYLSTFPVMFDAMPGIFDGGHLSSAGDFSFANIFFRSISLLASDGPLVDNMTCTGWLMKASHKTR